MNRIALIFPKEFPLWIRLALAHAVLAAALLFSFGVARAQTPGTPAWSCSERIILPLFSGLDHSCVATCHCADGSSYRPAWAEWDCPDSLPSPDCECPFGMSEEDCRWYRWDKGLTCQTVGKTPGECLAEVVLANPDVCVDARKSCPTTDGGEINTEPTDEDEADENPTDEDQTDENPVDKNPTDEDGTDENPADKNPTDEDGTDENPVDKNPTDEDGTDENPADKNPTDEAGTETETIPAENGDEKNGDENASARAAVNDDDSMRSALIAGGAAMIGIAAWNFLDPPLPDGAQIFPTATLAYRDGYSSAFMGFSGAFRNWNFSASSVHTGQGWGKPYAQIRWTWRF